jgi:hypothetical protein
MKSPLIGSDFYGASVADLDFSGKDKHISTTYGNDFLWIYFSFANSFFRESTVNFRDLWVWP